MSNIDKLRHSQQSAARMAKMTLNKFWNMYGHLPADELRDALLTFVPALADRYGDVAAAAAADWYEEVVASTTGRTASAVLAEVDVNALTGATRWAVGDLYEGNATAAWQKLEKSLLRQVKNAGRGTVERSSQRDGYAYARVPSGARTCAFCTMLASRGFVYGNAEQAGSIEKYHDDCDCLQVPKIAMGPTELAAFEARVAEMRDWYMAARSEVEADGLEPTDESIAQRLRDMFPSKFTDGATVPSIVREASSGWPEAFAPLSPGRWKHILKRHGPDGTAHDLFPAEMSEYEIAKTIRAVVTDPDFTKPHPIMGDDILNFFKIEGGRLVVVGTKVTGDGKVAVRTAFPPGEGTSIL